MNIKLKVKEQKSSGDIDVSVVKNGVIIHRAIVKPGCTLDSAASFPIFVGDGLAIISLKMFNINIAR